jgi:hypothetical protein
MRNENGFVLVTTLMVLCLLTIIGIASTSISNTELKISSNYYVHEKMFYAADSISAVAPMLGKDKTFHPESEYLNVDWLGENDMQIGEITDLHSEIRHQTAIDPADGIEKVVLYGDEDHDYLPEINYTTGVPLIVAEGTGTCRTRNGKSVVETRYIWEKVVILPDAALRVHSNVNGNGVSGSIIGEHVSGSDCGDVADIMYDLGGGTIEYGGDLGDTPRIEASTGMYPMPLIEPIMKNKADFVVPGSNNMDEDYLNSLSGPGDPKIIYIDGSDIVKSKTTNLTGYGILFIKGDFEFAGNVDWNGLILVDGNLTFSGGGTKMISGAVVASGDAEAINGSVDIQYDCDLLTSLDDLYSDYRLTSWRTIH